MNIISRRKKILVCSISLKCIGLGKLIIISGLKKKIVFNELYITEMFKIRKNVDCQKSICTILTMFINLLMKIYIPGKPNVR